MYSKVKSPERNLGGSLGAHVNQYERVYAMDSTTLRVDTQAWSFCGSAAQISKKNCPKVGLFDMGYIYVAQLSTGWVKVGRTIDPSERLKAILRGLRSTNVTIQRVAVTQPHVNVVENEKIVLSALKDAESDGEFFCVSYDGVIDLVAALDLKMRRTAAEMREIKLRRDATYNAFNTGFGTREGSLK